MLFSYFENDFQTEHYNMSQDRAQKCARHINSSLYENFNNKYDTLSIPPKVSYICSNGKYYVITVLNGEEITREIHYNEDGFITEPIEEGYIGLQDMFIQALILKNNSAFIKKQALEKASLKTKQRQINAKRALLINKIPTFNITHSNKTTEITNLEENIKNLFLQNKNNVKFNEQLTKNGVGIDRISFLVRKEDIRSGFAFKKKGPITIIYHKNCYKIHIESEIISTNHSLSDTILAAFSYLTSHAVFNKRVTQIMTKTYSNKTIQVKQLLQLMPICRLEIAFDFILPDFFKLLHKSAYDSNGVHSLKKGVFTDKSGIVTKTYYTSDYRKHLQDSLICNYERGKKISKNQDLYRLEIRYTKKYLKLFKFKPEFISFLNFPPIFLAYFNAVKIANAIGHTVQNPDVYKKLRVFIDEKPEYELLKYMLDYAFGY